MIQPDTDRIVVGLDIGTTKVCAVVGRYNEFGKVNILGIGKADCDGVSRGEVINVNRTAEAIRRAVTEAEDRSHVQIRSAFVGIAGQHIKSSTEKSIITLSGPNQQIKQSDVDRLSDEMYKLSIGPGQQIIHALPQEYKVDSHSDVKDPIGMSGVRLECNYHVVTALTSSIKNIYNCVRNADLDVCDIVLQPLASSYSVLTEEEMEAGVCLVDIGGGTTDLAIFSNNIARHTSVIPLGGNIITQDIQRGCSIMQKQAELLKTRYGSAFALEGMEDELITISGLKDRAAKEIRQYTLAKIIEARVEELAEFVLKEIYYSGYYKNLVGGIVLTGGGAQLTRIQELFAYVTGMDTHIGYPIVHLAQGMVEEVNNPSCATATGLVMYGLKHGIRRRPLVMDTDYSQPKATFASGEPQQRSSVTQKVRSFFESMINTANTID
jgi:cell division protein FtsA